MMDLFRKRPWLLVVIGLGCLVAMSLAFVVIATLNPPSVLPKTPF